MLFLVMFISGLLFGDILIKIIKHTANLILIENNIKKSDFYGNKFFNIVLVLIKFLSGLFLVLCYLKFGFGINCLCAFLFLGALLIISVIDSYFMIILDEIIFFLCLLSFYFASVNLGAIKFLDRIAGLILISGFMCLINLFKKDSFGFGDIKLVAISGFIFGIEKNFLVFIIAVMTASIFCVFMLRLSKKQFTDRIAFGPYICLGIAVNFFYGNEIILSYKSLFI